MDYKKIKNKKCPLSTDPLKAEKLKMKKHNLKFKISFKLLAIFLAFSFCLPGLTNKTNAASASLYLSPSNGAYAIGSNFSVRVKVNSGGGAINAAEGSLTFNPGEISVISISKGGSIFNLWTAEPAFSNPAGSITFSGGTTSGFTGTAGTIFTITFKAKAVATSKINFSSGSVLAADGKGTNILSSMSGGTYTFKPKVISPPAGKIPPGTKSPSSSSSASIISSPTHPDSEKWYSNNNPEFSWDLPADINGVSIYFSESSESNPGPVSDGLFNKKLYQNIENGIWYFHIKLKNRFGWGSIIHRKILIDAEIPKPFKIKSDNGGDATNPNPILIFQSEDTLSGIEFYKVVIDGEQTAKISLAENDNPYKMPFQLPGKHIVIVKAFDKANNFIESSTDLTIEPIEPPIITDFPQRIEEGDNLIIKGSSLYPKGKLTIFVKKEGKEPLVNNVETDSKGNWFYIHPESLKGGIYQVWAQIADQRGAKSNSTEKNTIEIVLPDLIKFGKIAINYLSILVSLAALIIVLIGIIFYGWFKISKIRKKLRKETKEANQSVSRSFQILRREIQKQIEYFDEKPGLTKKEKETRDDLIKVLNVSEKFIKKEIKDIEKEIK